MLRCANPPTASSLSLLLPAALPQKETGNISGWPRTLVPPLTSPVVVFVLINDNASSRNLFTLLSYWGWLLFYSSSCSSSASTAAAAAASSSSSSGFAFFSGHTEQQLQREEQHQFWNCYISVAHLTSLRGLSTWDTHSIHSLSAPPLSPYHSCLLSALLFSSLCSVLKLVINFYAQNMQMLHWWIHSLGTGPSPRGRGIFWGVTSFSTSLPKFDARDASTGNCQPHFVFSSPSLSLFVDFQRTFLKEMKNFMSYFLFNFFRFFLCTPLLSPHLRKWACAWPAAKLIMDERSASCRIVARRLASRRNVAQLTLFLIPELPTFGRR